MSTNNMFDAILEEATQSIIAWHDQVIKDDDIGAMMTFLDEVKYPYEHYTDLQPDEANYNIRVCFQHAFVEATGDAFQRARVKVRKHVWAEGARLDLEYEG